MITSGLRKWADSVTATATSLNRYRVIFAAYILLRPPQFSQRIDARYVVFDPPPGPFALLDDLPPLIFLQAVDVIIVVAAAMLLVGCRPGVSALALGWSMLVGYGLLYSVAGGIQHSILLVVTPLVLARPWKEAAQGQVPQWRVRWLALIIGVAMFTAGWAKATGGWLDPTTQAAFGHFLNSYVAQGRSTWATETIGSISTSLLWETVDWATVVLECSLLVLVVSLRGFRIGLALLAALHFAIMLSLGIVYATNVIVYAAFVPWDRIRLPQVRAFSSARSGMWRCAAALGIVALIYAVDPVPRQWLQPTVVTAGFAVAVGHLVCILLRVRRTLFR